MPFPVVPPHVEYSLTKDGEKCVNLLAMLGEWSGQNKEIVKNIAEMRTLANASAWPTRLDETHT